MIPDYDFYKYVYKGSKLSEDDFDKYISKAISVISSYTMDRVNETTIVSFPEPVSLNIKKCACEISEFIYDVEKVNNNAISYINTQNQSNSNNIKSMSAGAVSVTYDNTSSSKIQSQYIDLKYIKTRYKSILDSYLYPQYVNGQYYNLLSWVGN